MSRQDVASLQAFVKLHGEATARAALEDASLAIQGNDTRVTYRAADEGSLFRGGEAETLTTVSAAGGHGRARLGLTKHRFDWLVSSVGDPFMSLAR